MKNVTCETFYHFLGPFSAKDKIDSHCLCSICPLRWLIVWWRIRSKITARCFKYSKSLAPAYLVNMASIYTPKRTLRSPEHKYSATMPKLKCDFGYVILGNGPTGLFQNDYASVTTICIPIIKIRRSRNCRIFSIRIPLKPLDPNDLPW